MILRFVAVAVLLLGVSSVTQAQQCVGGVCSVVQRVVEKKPVRTVLRQAPVVRRAYRLRRVTVFHRRPLRRLLRCCR